MIDSLRTLTLSSLVAAGLLAAWDARAQIAPTAPDAPTAASSSDSIPRGDATSAAPAARDSIARGDATIDTVLALPEVRVTGARTPSAARRRLPTAHVSEIALAATPRALGSLSDALGEAAGVRIVQYGGLGAFSAASLRGAPPGQVAIHLDGVPITSAAHGVVNLADLPASAIEKVEVYRGVAPLSWAAPLPGGAINLVTARAPSLREARISRGSFGTTEARATAGATRGPFGALLHAGYQGSDGDFAFLDDNDTPFNLEDDATGTRGNNRFDAATVLGSLSATLAGVDGRLRIDHFEKRQGLPGRGANPARTASLGFARSLAALEAVVPARGLVPGVRADLALGRERLKLFVDEWHLGWGEHRTNDRFDDRLGRIALEWQRLPLGLALETGGSLRVEDVRLADAAAALDPPPSRRRTAGAFVVVRLETLESRLLLHAGRRWDRVRDALRWTANGSVRSSDVVRVLNAPQLGARVLGPGGLELRANWTDATRPPDPLELFGNQGASQGNPGLMPERAESWDAGLAWSGSAGPLRARIEAAHFDTRTRDLIVFVRNSPNSTKPMNVTRALVRGDELSAHAALGGLSAQITATWQTAVDRGPVPFWNGKRLPQRPERQWFARLGWEGARMGGAVEGTFLGENFLDRYNRTPVPSRLLAGAAFYAVAPLAIPLRLVVEGKNLGDERAADVSGYPLPGRSVYVSLQARSGRDPVLRGPS